MANYKLFICFGIIICLGMISLINAADLIINSGTTTLGGNYTYDTVYVASGAILQIDGTIGYLNITAVKNITIEGTIYGYGMGVVNGGATISQHDSDGSPGGGSGGGSGGLRYYSSGADMQGSGGGGGGSGSSGGNGGTTPNRAGGGGGGSYGSSTSMTFNLGSGGGSGGVRSSYTYCQSGGGGNGGGALLLNSRLINITGVINLDGNTGGDGSSCANNNIGSGGGGGGSGGTILLEGYNIYLNNSNVHAVGAHGGNGYIRFSGNDAGGGGAGAGGRIKVFYQNIMTNGSSTFSVNGASSGSGAGSGGSGGSSSAGTIYYSQQDLGFNPSVTLISPSDNLYTATTLQTFTCSQLSPAGTLINNTLYIWQGNTIITTNTTSLSGVSGTTSNDYNFTSDNTFKWNCLVCDSSTCAWASTNRTIYVQATAPTVRVTLPTIPISYGYSGKNITLNFTSTSGLLNSCWYVYNGITTATTCNTATTYLLTTNNSLVVYANDSAGNVGMDNLNMFYTVFENSITYDSSALSGDTGTFILDANIVGGYNSIQLIYNNTAYTSNVTQIGNDEYRISNLITLPAIGTSTVNKSFYWKINTTSANITTQTHIQTLNPFLLVPCNSTYNVTALNFTIKEEATFNLLNGSLALNLIYWPANGDGKINQTLLYNNLAENQTNYAFCINPGDKSYSISGILQYAKTAYDPRTYIFSNATINNQTQNISLYLLATASSDVFTFNVINENDQPVSGATVYVQRWDIGTGNFYTVGMVTTSGGQATINLNLNAGAYYRELVFYNNILYLTTDPAVETTSSTPKTLRIYLTQPSPYLTFNSIPYTFTYTNATKTFTFVYADPTGAVAIGCLDIYSMDLQNGNNLVYTSCVQSTSGTLSYTLSQNGTFVGNARLILTPTYESTSQVVDSIFVTMGTAARYGQFKTFGYVASFLLIGTLAMIGVATGSIPLGCVLIIAGMVLSSLIGLINFSTTVLYGFIGLVAIVAFTALRKFS